MDRGRRAIRGFSFLAWAVALGVAPLAAADAPEAAGDDPVGRVVSLSGEVLAERPGQAPRRLQCRDGVYQGERLVTSGDAHVGVLFGDAFAHLGERSRLRVGSTPDETADLALEAGAVRVVDPRDAGADARLSVLDARARVHGNDAEAYVFSEKTGGYAVLCEWDEPLTVSRKQENAVAEPGQCVIAKRSEPLYVSRAHEERLGAPGQDACALEPLIGALDLHLSPTDVAAGPLLAPWSDAGTALVLPPRDPCDVPGSGCGTILEPVPVGGGFGGGSGVFTGVGGP